MYDFMVFGYYASAIGATFFPSGIPFVSLMLSLMTFGAGFLMRPLGAIVLGAYTDVHGRRKGLILTLTLMSFGIVTIACTPGYASIGVLAPILVLLGRLVQGFSAGMELGGVSVYLSEIATPGHKGFYVSWQAASQQVAVMFAAVVGLVRGRVRADRDRVAESCTRRALFCDARTRAIVRARPPSIAYWGGAKFLTHTVHEYHPWREDCYVDSADPALWPRYFGVTVDAFQFPLASEVPDHRKLSWPEAGGHRLPATCCDFEQRHPVLRLWIYGQL